MPKISVESTNAGNLEAKFDASEEVLDYFDPQTARALSPADLGSHQALSRTGLERALQIAVQIQTLEQELISLLKSEMSAAEVVPGSAGLGV